MATTKKQKTKTTTPSRIDAFKKRYQSRLPAHLRNVSKQADENYAASLKENGVGNETVTKKKSKVNKPKSVKPQNPVWETKPLTAEAYTVASGWGKMFPKVSHGDKHVPPLNCFRTYYDHKQGKVINLGWGYLLKISTALQRQLVLDDLKLFFKVDGVHVCEITHRKFHALAWRSFDDDTVTVIISRIVHGQSLKEAVNDIPWDGQHFYGPKGKVLSYSGAPHPVRGNWSPLASACKRFRSFGYSYDSACEKAKQVSHQFGGNVGTNVGMRIVKQSQAAKS